MAGRRQGLRSYLRALGPGLVTGASDDDPSGIATYAQAGSAFGFGLLWTALLTFPLMATVQEICDRTALATGKGLGELASRRLGGKGRNVVVALVGLLIVANALNIAADLVAVGAGMHLLHAGPAAAWAPLAGVGISLLLLSGSFAFVARVFKLLCLALFSYIAMLFIVKVRWSSVLHATFVPHVSLHGNAVALLVAVLGTTISPYLFSVRRLQRHGLLERRHVLDHRHDCRDDRQAREPHHPGRARRGERARRDALLSSTSSCSSARSAALR